MTFHWPHLFWLLLVPLALLVFDLRRRRGRGQSVAHPKILRAEAGTHDLELRPGETSQLAAPRVRWRLCLGLALLTAGLARPQWGRVDEPVFDQAREIMIALDLSRSMLAPDVRPSRLERARLLVTSLLERLAGERVGLIVFSGTAFLQSPLSSDYEILNEFLPSLNPDYLPEGGTNYRSLIETALNAFGTSGAADRFLIVLSDGEATDEDWKNAAQQLKEKGIRVIGLGVGTAQGAIIPDGSGGYVKDERGAVVMSKLEPATLQELAKMTNGVYADASSWIDVAQLIQSTVETGRKGQFREERQVRLVERFQWALGPALLFLLWSFYAEFPVRPRARDVKLRRAAQNPGAAASTTAIVALCAICAASVDPSRAAVTDTNGSSAAEPLSKLVGQFAERPSLTARDYAELARATLTYGERQKSAQQPVVEGAIHDGLAAVDAGAALDPKAAEWDKLRHDLEKLLEKPNQPPPQNQDQQQKDQQQKDQQKNQQDQKNDSSQNNQEQKQDSSSDPSQKPSQQNEKNSGQEPKENPSQDSQSDPQKQQQPKPQQNQQSAFGDMNKKDDPPQQPKPQPAQPQNPSDMQKVGGAQEAKNDPAGKDPAMLVPLQRLQQLRSQDSPVRLQQIMRNDQPTPPSTKGKNW